MPRNKKTSYKCPICNKEQVKIGQRQTWATLYYNYNLETEQWEKDDQVAGDENIFYCINCGEDLDNDFVDSLGHDS